MTENSVGLIAAMPEETGPLVRLLGASRNRNFGFPVYTFGKPGIKGFLIESGVGMEQAARATRALVDAACPELIINFGFAGAILPGPTVGDIVVAANLLAFKEKICTHVPGAEPQLAEKLTVVLREEAGTSCRVHCGTFVTAGEIIGKKMIAGLLPTTATTPVLEMETAAVAHVAQEKNISFIAIRAISDEADEELTFTINDFVDRNMQVRAHKVLWTLARKPWLIPQLVRLAQNSRVAGKNLAAAVMTILNHDSGCVSLLSYPFETGDHG